MSIISETHALRGIEFSEKMLDEAIATNDLNIVTFCYKMLWRGYLADCEEVMKSPPSILVSTFKTVNGFSHLQPPLLV